MFSLAAEHPALAAFVLLSVGWVASFLRKGYQIRKTFHGQVCYVTTFTMACSRLRTDKALVWATTLVVMGSLEGDG